MTLKEAIRTVLLRQGEHTATTREISEQIKVEGLYTRKDGASAKAQQVNARARRHPEWFEFKRPGLVRFVGMR